MSSPSQVVSTVNAPMRTSSGWELVDLDQLFSNTTVHSTENQATSTYDNASQCSFDCALTPFETKYTTALSALMWSTDTFPAQNDPAWKQLLALLEPRDLVRCCDDHTQFNVVRYLGFSCDLAAPAATSSFPGELLLQPKTLDRVHEQASWSPFCAQADLVSLRIKHSARADLSRELDRLLRLLAAIPNHRFAWKGDPNGPTFEHDILAKGYLWAPDLRYIVEIVICHPFAAWVQDMDRQRREAPQKLKLYYPSFRPARGGPDRLLN